MFKAFVGLLRLRDETQHWTVSLDLWFDDHLQLTFY